MKYVCVVMLLSCPAKKVTKECGIGEALRVALPRAKDALSYVPLPSRIEVIAEEFTGKSFWLWLYQQQFCTAP